MKMMLARSGFMFSASASSRLTVAAKSGRQISGKIASTHRAAKPDDAAMSIL
jgi:hypothetical protein